LPNKERRSREHLTEHEVETIARAASKRGRHGHRDRTMILLCFRHGLRASELCGLRWDQVNLDEAAFSEKSSPPCRSCR
jgi:integrase